MGCLEVAARCLTIPMAVSAWGQKELEVSAFSSVPEVDVGISVVNKRMNVSCGIVCSVTPKEYYLNVEPDVVWLSPSDLEGYFNIYSNVDWQIRDNQKYVEVNPNVVWLTPEMLKSEFDIYSNTSWMID